jgi:hypothetical protein
MHFLSEDAGAEARPTAYQKKEERRQPIKKREQGRRDLNLNEHMESTC